MLVRHIARYAAARLPRAGTAAAPARNSSILARPLRMHSLRPVLGRNQYAAFSSVGALREKAGQVDQEFAAKLGSEISIEKEIRETAEMPAEVADFLETGGWTLHDVAGREDVSLTRKFGDETIRVSITTADIGMAEDMGVDMGRMNEFDEDEDDVLDEDDDDDITEEEEEEAEEDVVDVSSKKNSNNKGKKGHASIPAQSAQSGGANTKGSVNHGAKASKGGNMDISPPSSTKEKSAADVEEDDEELDLDEAEDDDEMDPSPLFPARMSISITKPGVRGALEFDGQVHEGELVIQRMAHRDGVAAANAAAAGKGTSGRSPGSAAAGGGGGGPQGDFDTVPTSAGASTVEPSRYEGPPWDNLDENLQMLAERYLDERGVNTALALWVPEYLDFKEQREYLAWLGRVKGFIDA